MTGFTHVCFYHLSVITREYHAHNRIHSRELQARQDSLMSIKLRNRSYSQVRIFNSSAIACKQCASCVAWAQHASCLQNFSRHNVLLAFFVNLDMSCTVEYRATITCESQKCKIWSLKWYTYHQNIHNSHHAAKGMVLMNKFTNTFQLNVNFTCACGQIIRTLVWISS